MNFGGGVTPAAWELRCELSAREHGVVWRCHPGVTILRVLPGGRFKGAWKRSGPPDLLGTTSSGHAIACEVKSTLAKSWRPKGRGGLIPHQAGSLAAMHRSGGVSGVALLLRRGKPDQVARWLPWSWLADIYKAGGVVRASDGVEIVDEDWLRAAL